MKRTLITIATILIASTAHAQSQLPQFRGVFSAGNAGWPTDGLLLSYDFRKGADAQVLYDLSGNDKHCRLGSSTGVDSADPIWTLNGGLDFNATSQYALCPAINLTGDATFVIMYNSGTPSGGYHTMLLGAYNTVSPYQGWAVGNSITTANGKMQYWSGAKGAWVTGNTAVQDGLWHTLVVTVADTNVTFYVDGVADGALTSARPNAWAGQMYIGANNGQHFAMGTIGYVRIYSRSFSAGDVARTQAVAAPIMVARDFRYRGAPKVPFPPSFTTVPDNGLARTPPMGWSSWNLSHDITEAQIKAQTDAVVSRGLAAAGYEYVIIDEPGTTARDLTGQPIAHRFPSGLKSTCDYIHAAGLKCGYYTTPGKQTCKSTSPGGFQLGSYGREFTDAALFAAAGVDYLKNDWCSADTDYAAHVALYGYPDTMRAVYQYMGQAIQASGRPMVYSIGTAVLADSADVWEWGTLAGGNLWRTGGDVGPSWASVETWGFRQVGISQYASVGHWNDPDMLQVGNISDDEGRTQMSLWAILAAPLLAGTNLATASATTIATLTNADVIAVDQDASGIQGRRIAQVACGSTTCEVWARQLTGTNTCAIGLFNRDAVARDITVTFTDVAAVIAACGVGPYGTTKDLWAGTSLGTLTTSYTATAVPAHGVAMIRVAP